MLLSRLNQGSTAKLTAAALAAAALAAILTWAPAPAQIAPVNGMRPADLRTHAITGATVIPAPGQKLENATIIVREGVIQAVGSEVEIPAGARIWNAEGLHVYPGLIEPALLISVGDVPRSAGAHWNTRVRPEISIAELAAPDAALRKDLRSMGFTTAAVYPSTGIFRGTGAVIALAEDNEHVLAYQPRAAMAGGFDYGGFGRGGGPGGGASQGSAYPGSLMGAIALVRQTLSDAQWHAACRKVWTEHPEGNEPPLRAEALEALADVVGLNGRPLKQQLLFDVSDEHNAIRAARIASEFNLNMVLLGSGYEFRRLGEIVALGLPLIVPVDYPKRPDVSALNAADNVSLRDLMTWEQAPTNARRLINAGANVSLTTHRLRSRSEFHANVRSAIKHGLTEDQALAALTTAPAALLGLDAVLGTIEPGKAANFVVVKGALFDKEMKVHDTWINGRRYEIHKDPEIQLVGSGTLSTTRTPPDELKVDIDTKKSSVSFQLADKKKASAKKVTVQQDQLSFIVDGRPFNVEGYVRLAGVMEGTPPNSLTGTGALPDGSTFNFTVAVTPKADGQDKDGAATRPAEVAAAETEKKEGEESSANSDAGNEPSGAATPSDAVTGLWTIDFDDAPGGRLTVTLDLSMGDNNSVSGSVSVMGQSASFSGAKFDPSTGKLTIAFESPLGGAASIDADVSGNSMRGVVTSPNFTRDFVATRSSDAGGQDGKKDEEAPFIAPPEQLNVPLGDYGVVEAPKPRSILITNATIWTAGPQGIIRNGSMLVINGKIRAIGPGNAAANVPDAVGFETIDAGGKHITPGLIDCHSHTGIDGGVNEFGQTNTAEVRIGDVIDPDDINWYRQLAGGLTACNQLHGSANPIGGQNSVVKLKWAAPAKSFPIETAVSGIKFALGENVKRSTNRYPNTRMGVETFIRDAFTAARDYKARWDHYLAMPSEARARTMPPQRDLELETLVEILDGQRLVHCHSYRQDEILMLIRLADSFGFTIGTFQHVLEGYKVADDIAKHGAGASSFSDWWAYKVEVMDAIPYNGALMKDVGVLVSFNSDSDELARRMNTEASKAVRYGGVDPHEALKFVTINPARQLRIDNRTGSLETGKDADFVIWSADPLSVYARCEQTWIEGARYFDLQTDRQLREQVKAERQRIINKILVQAHGDPTKAGSSGSGGDRGRGEGAGEGERRPGGDQDDRPRRRPRPTPELMAWIDEQLRLGRTVDEIRPGDCGCGGIHEHLSE